MYNLLSFIDKYDSVLILVLIPIVQWARRFYLEIKEEIKQSKEVHLGLYNQIQHMNKQLDELLERINDKDGLDKLLKDL